MSYLKTFLHYQFDWPLLKTDRVKYIEKQPKHSREEVQGLFATVSQEGRTCFSSCFAPAFANKRLVLVKVPSFSRLGLAGRITLAKRQVLVKKIA